MTSCEEGVVFLCGDPGLSCFKTMNGRGCLPVNTLGTLFAAQSGSAWLNLVVAVRLGLSWMCT